MYAHLEQCIQMYIQTYAEIVSHSKHCLWCLISCNWTVELCLSLFCLAATKVFISFCSAYFSKCVVLISECVFSVYCAGSSGITQNLEMHDQISLIELLHQYCTRFNSISLIKIVLALPDRNIKTSFANSRFYLHSHKRNTVPKFLRSHEYHFQLLNVGTGIQPLLKQFEANVTNI